MERLLHGREAGSEHRAFCSVSAHNEISCASGLAKSPATWCFIVTYEVSYEISPNHFFMLKCITHIDTAYQTSLLQWRDTSLSASLSNPTWKVIWCDLPISEENWEHVYICGGYWGLLKVLIGL